MYSVLSLVWGRFFYDLVLKVWSLTWNSSPLSVLIIQKLVSFSGALDFLMVFLVILIFLYFVRSSTLHCVLIYFCLLYSTCKTCWVTGFYNSNCISTSVCLSPASLLDSILKPGIVFLISLTFMLVSPWASLGLFSLISLSCFFVSLNFLNSLIKFMTVLLNSESWLHLSNSYWQTLADIYRMGR